MKKNYLLFILFIFYSFIISAQNKLYGRYYSESGVYFEIKDDKFKLIMLNSAINGFYSDILAEGTMKYIDNSFIELNSLISPVYEIFRTLKITQSEQGLMDNDIEIKFLIPYKRDSLRIAIYTDKFKTFKFSYSDYNKSIIIPKGVNSFSFMIEPENIITHNFDGTYYGVLSLNSLEYNIEKEIKLIEVNIPALDDSFFEKYYLKGDYVRIVNKSIIWKGEVFNKME